MRDTSSNLVCRLIYIRPRNPKIKIPKFNYKRTFNASILKSFDKLGSYSTNNVIGKREKKDASDFWFMN